MPLPRFPNLPDEPPEALRVLWDYLRTASESLSVSEIASAGTLFALICIVVADRFFGLDATLSWLSDFVPMAIAVVGIVMSYKQPKEKNHFAATVVLILSGFVGSGILHWSRTRDQSAHKTEVTGLTTRMDAVRDQNSQILTYLLPKPGTIQTGQATELERRQDIEKALRGEYILSHEHISPGLLAGTEFPPAEWMNKRLAELGEKWTVSPPSNTTRVIPPKIEIAQSYGNLRQRTLNLADKLTRLVRHRFDQLNTWYKTAPGLSQNGQTTQQGRLEWARSNDSEFRACCLAEVQSIHDEFANHDFKDERLEQILAGEKEDARLSKMNPAMSPQCSIYPLKTSLQSPKGWKH